MKSGDLIQITRKPTDSEDAKNTSFWNEASGMSVFIPVDEICNPDQNPPLGNPAKFTVAKDWQIAVSNPALACVGFITVELSVSLFIHPFPSVKV